MLVLDGKINELELSDTDKEKIEVLQLMAAGGERVLFLQDCGSR